MKAASHREVVPVESSFAAKIVGALARGLRPCTQLCVDMALEAACPRPDRSGCLRPGFGAMSDTNRLRLVCRRVCAGRPTTEFRDAVRAKGPQKALVDLTWRCKWSDFPMVKQGSVCQGCRPASS